MKALPFFRLGVLVIGIAVVVTTMVFLFAMVREYLRAKKRTGDGAG